MHLHKRRRSPDDLAFFVGRGRGGPIEPLIRERRHSRHKSRDDGTSYLNRQPRHLPWNSPERSGLVGVYNRSISPDRDDSPGKESVKSNRSMSNLSTR